MFILILSCYRDRSLDFVSLKNSSREIVVKRVRMVAEAAAGP